MLSTFRNAKVASFFYLSSILLLQCCDNWKCASSQLPNVPTINTLGRNYRVYATEGCSS